MFSIIMDILPFCYHLENAICVIVSIRLVHVHYLIHVFMVN
uniref:Uncharacterized protein n=1 Tax=Rhizophora mucronata TaxID=61149 RepID=A0A2P2QN15_RHIMU